MPTLVGYLRSDKGQSARDHKAGRKADGEGSPEE